jgi:hypothetical protein
MYWRNGFMKLVSRVAKMEELVTRAGDNARMKPRYADPVSVQWAQFLWDGGSLDAVPEEFREEAETLYEAAKILEELHARNK